jgi:hypothetical protein
MRVLCSLVLGFLVSTSSGVGAEGKKPATNAEKIVGTWTLPAFDQGVLAGVPAIVRQQTAQVRLVQALERRLTLRRKLAVGRGLNAAGEAEETWEYGRKVAEIRRQIAGGMVARWGRLWRDFWDGRPQKGDPR